MGVFSTYRVTPYHTCTPKLAEMEKDHLSRYSIKTKRIVQAMFVPGNRLVGFVLRIPYGRVRV